MSSSTRFEPIVRVNDVLQGDAGMQQRSSRVAMVTGGAGRGVEQKPPSPSLLDNQSENLLADESRLHQRDAASMTLTSRSGDMDDFESAVQRLRLRRRMAKASHRVEQYAEDNQFADRSHPANASRDPAPHSTTPEASTRSMPTAYHDRIHSTLSASQQVLTDRQLLFEQNARDGSQSFHGHFTQMPLMDHALPSRRYSTSRSIDDWSPALMAEAVARISRSDLQYDLPESVNSDYSESVGGHSVVDSIEDMDRDHDAEDGDEEGDGDGGVMSDGELLESLHAVTSTNSHTGLYVPREETHGRNPRRCLREQEREIQEFNHRVGHEPHSAEFAMHQSQDGPLSNRAINTSKAIALKNAVLRNLTRLGFEDNVTMSALDAGVQEIAEYDSDCELAYADIFISLIKMVCDAHQDHEQYGAHDTPLNSAERMDRMQAHTTLDGQHGPSSPLPFKWPVFDMAQFEFGNARAGTCYDSVCVLINLPKVALDRTEELMEVLSCHLFSMIGDPIQVVIPSENATGRTKGHAFLEFDDPSLARACAAAIDGMAWGRGPGGRIRANLFREYRVKSPTPPRTGGGGVRMSLRAGSPAIPLSFSRSGASSTQSRRSLRLQSSHHSDDTDRRLLSRDDLTSSVFSGSSASFNTNSQISTGLSSGLEDSARRSGILAHSTNSDRRGFSRSRGSVRRRDGEDEEGSLRHGRDDVMRMGELRLSSDTEEGDNAEVSGTESELELELDEMRLEHTALPRSTRASRVQRFRQSMPPLMTDHRQSLAPTPPMPINDTEAGTADGPWKSYCEELIARNREMQEQVTYSRRRIAALGHNNQKLHLLIDRMERDRDGLLFENDLLQTQLHGYEDHEQQQEALMRELAALRRRMRRRDQRLERGFHENSTGGGSHDASGGHEDTSRVAVELEGGVTTLEDLEEQLVHNIVSSRRLDDLKEWEQMLESSLARVRSIKEEIALELQQRLAAQQTSEDTPVEDHKLCVVCLSSEKSILCLPCRHLCLCQECSQHRDLVKCPICRLRVDNMLLVYA